MGGVVVGASYNLSWCHPVASRRLAYRRLQENVSKNNKIQSDASASDDVVVITEQEEGLDLK